MKNISPVSPLNEIVPDNNASQTDNPQSSPVLQSAPSQAEVPLSAPVAQADTVQSTDSIPEPPTEKPFYQESTSLYPTPLSPEERNTLRTELADSRRTGGGMTISQFGIMLVVGIYALAEGMRLFRAVTTSGFLTMAGGGSYIGSYVWAVLLIGLLQVAALIFAAYKVSQGSFAGLTFISGIGMMLLPQTILLYIIAPNLIGVAFNSLQSAAQFIGLFGLLLMLILAWTKERKFYN